MLIGITGTDGSGKGTVVEYLVSEKGFTHCSARGIFIKELNRRGKESTRINLRLMGNEFREKFGNDFLITHYLKKIAEEGIEKVVIESIRAVDEAKTLKANQGVLIAVDADQKLRYKRVQERRSESDRVSFEEFVAHEDLEINDPDPHGMQKRKVMEMADYTLLNNGTREEFHMEIEQVYQNIFSVQSSQ